MLSPHSTTNGINSAEVNAYFPCLARLACERGKAMGIGSLATTWSLFEKILRHMQFQKCQNMENVHLAIQQIYKFSFTET